jgi:hypothetical protein
MRNVGGARTFVVRAVRELGAPCDRQLLDGELARSLDRVARLETTDSRIVRLLLEAASCNDWSRKTLRSIFLAALPTAACPTPAASRSAFTTPREPKNCGQGSRSSSDLNGILGDLL